MDVFMCLVWRIMHVVTRMLMSVVFFVCVHDYGHGCRSMRLVPLFLLVQVRFVGSAQLFSDQVRLLQMRLWLLWLSLSVQVEGLWHFADAALFCLILELYFVSGEASHFKVVEVAPSHGHLCHGTAIWDKNGVEAIALHLLPRDRHVILIFVQDHWGRLFNEIFASFFYLCFFLEAAGMYGNIITDTSRQFSAFLSVLCGHFEAHAAIFLHREWHFD